MKTNILPFLLGDWPIDALDQSMMRQLRSVADEKGVSVEFVVHEAAELYASRSVAEKELSTKIISFPK